jgi:hypothetical protein
MIFIIFTNVVFISAALEASAANRSLSQIFSLLLLDPIDQQIQDVKTVSTVIVSNDVSIPNITVGKITFETSSTCSTSVEVNGKFHDAGTGVWHEAYIYGSSLKLAYTIHATTRDGIKSHRSEVLIGDTSMRFTYQGEINGYLDYLVPVVINICETYPTRGDLIDVVLLGGIDYFSLFQKENVFSMQEKTIRELYDSFSRWYEKNRSVLKSAWPLFSDDQLKVASILNAVSYLWHYGNFNLIYRVGCAQVNELISEDSGDFIYPDGRMPPIYFKRFVGMTDYLNSKIGCCTDHAFLTKALLEQAGFESRRVVIGIAHITTEVFIDSSWYNIDATGGLLVNASIESMIEGIQRKVYLFFTPYMYFDSPAHYASIEYPWFPTFVMGAGFEEGGGAMYKSQLRVIVGYDDYEIAQLNGN